MISSKRFNRRDFLCLGVAHELIPDVTDYFPTEADYRLIASSYGRKP